jgi:hypothetical protein
MSGAATEMPTRSTQVITASVAANAVTTYRALEGVVVMNGYLTDSSLTAIVRHRQKPPSTQRGVFASLKCI